MSKIKLIDVAEKARVSKSTVSQFLNGRFEYMSKDTRERVKQAVEALNYVPNNIARSLKTDTTRTVGVVVRDVAGFYTSQAIRGMDDYCKSRGYNMVIYNTDFDPTTEAQAISSLLQLRVDGLLVASSGANKKLIAETSSNSPVVQFQLEHDDSDKSIIVSNYRQAAFDATNYLIELGHERIAFFTQKFVDIKSRRERYNGYVDAIAQQGLKLDRKLIQYWHRKTGLQSSPRELLQIKNAPTAFFSQHLAITADLLRALSLDDINVPDDISLLGFDDIPMADFFKIPVTVVQQQPYVVGTEAAKLLIETIRNPGTKTRRIEVACSLKKRSSCKSVND